MGAVRQISQELQRIATNALGGDVATHITDESLRHAVFTGYADRLAKRRPGFRDRFLLASGHGAALARESADVDGDYIVALDVVAAEREGISESRIRAASRVEREWIQPTSTSIEHRVDAENGRARAARIERYDAIVLSETPVPVDTRPPRHSSPRRGSRASTTPRQRNFFAVCDSPASTSTCVRSSIWPRRRCSKSARSILPRIFHLI